MAAIYSYLGIFIPRIEHGDRLYVKKNERMNWWTNFLFLDASITDRPHFRVTEMAFIGKSNSLEGALPPGFPGSSSRDPECFFFRNRKQNYRLSWTEDELRYIKALYYRVLHTKMARAKIAQQAAGKSEPASKQTQQQNIVNFSKTAVPRNTKINNSLYFTEISA